MTDAGWRKLELGLVLVTAAAFLTIPKPPDAVVPMAIFVPSCILGWVGYGSVRLRSDPTLWDRWGLRPTAHLDALLPRLIPALVLIVAALAGFTMWLGRPLQADWLWLSLLLYPVWGLVQQWLVQCLVVDNVRALTGASLPWLMALGAVGFGAVHVQHLPLVVATGLLGLAYVAVFQRWRNLWPLALGHGWLGSLFYPWVLGLSPLADAMDAVSRS